MTRPASSARRIGALVLYNIAATVVLLLVLEGIASVYYAFREAFVSPPVAESLYTAYDRDLGWVNLPNIYLPNMYGPGKYLRTNSQRFRNNEDFTLQVPPGKTRIICSGDSFTLGFGVDNDHTWPQLLAARAPNIETVNMGQGGYGADQAYLWYKRDGAPAGPQHPDSGAHHTGFLPNAALVVQRLWQAGTQGRERAPGHDQCARAAFDGSLVAEAVARGKCALQPQHHAPAPPCTEARYRPSDD